MSLVKKLTDDKRTFRPFYEIKAKREFRVFWIKLVSHWLEIHDASRLVGTW